MAAKTLDASRKRADKVTARLLQREQAADKTATGYIRGIDHALRKSRLLVVRLAQQVRANPADKAKSDAYQECRTNIGRLERSRGVAQSLLMGD
jgi:hypothetical protein